MNGRSGRGPDVPLRLVALEEAGDVRPGRKSRVFWSALVVVTALDVVTKYFAHTRLPLHRPHEVLGEWFRITLGYNPGAAFGLSLGAHSRWLFTALAIIALGIMGAIYRATAPGHWVQVLALGLISGGAIGNVINRLWSQRGVVDFLDVGIGDSRWPTFNVADIGITVGALLLAVVLWREDGGSPGATSSGSGAAQPPE